MLVEFLATTVKALGACEGTGIVLKINDNITIISYRAMLAVA